MDDEFSSVNWDRPATNREPMYQEESGSDALPSFNTHPAMRPTSAEDERTKISCTVTEPLKEAPGTRDSYISYLVTTHSTLPVFQKPQFYVRRRYNDFVFLHGQLTQSHPACAIPPLPDKNASAYIKGGRFDSDFTNRRCHSLHHFLQRCTLHPTLKRAGVLHTFLESREWNTFTKSSHHNRSGTMDGGGVLDGLSDVFVNAFQRVSKTDKRFTDVRDRTEKLARDLGSIEKLIVRIVRREVELESDFREMASQCERLAVVEQELGTEFTSLAKAMSGTSEAMKRLKEQTDAAYLTSLRDEAAYNISLKTLLKIRDQKQLDFEYLTDYQTKTTLERDQLASGYTNTGFIRHKVEDLRGLNHEQIRKEKLQKVEGKVDDLRKETEKAKLTSELFDEEVVREVAIFEKTKGVEMKESMLDYAQANIAFYRQVCHLTIAV